MSALPYREGVGQGIVTAGQEAGGAGPPIFEQRLGRRFGYADDVSPEKSRDYVRIACERPFCERLRKVIDQRVTSIPAMLCSHSCRASPVR